MLLKHQLPNPRKQDAEPVDYTYLHSAKKSTGTGTRHERRLQYKIGNVPELPERDSVAKQRKLPALE